MQCKGNEAELSDCKHEKWGDVDPCTHMDDVGIECIAKQTHGTYPVRMLPISMSNSIPFLICTAYRPQNATFDWIDKLEAELSKSQATGLEIVLMGDINIDYKSCSNTKWLQLILPGWSQISLE